MAVLPAAGTVSLGTPMALGNDSGARSICAGQ